MCVKRCIKRSSMMWLWRVRNPKTCSWQVGGPEKIVKRQPLSRVQLFVAPWTALGQASLFMEFSRQEYWSGLPFPSPGDLPDPGIKSKSPALQEASLPSELLGNSYGYGSSSSSHLKAGGVVLAWKQVEKEREGEFFLLQPFCSIQAFSGPDEAHPQRGRKPALLRYFTQILRYFELCSNSHPLIQMLISPCNNLKDTPRRTFNLMSGHPMAQSS